MKSLNELMLSRRTFGRMALVGAMGAVLGTVGCGSKEAAEDDAAATTQTAASYEVEYGESKLYDQATIDAAIAVVMAEFDGWQGCTMQKIAFTDDETCTADVDYCNSLRDEDVPEFDQAMVLLSDFHSPSEEESEGTAWEPDTDYTDYEWHLARTGDGDWQLLTWGY